MRARLPDRDGYVELDGVKLGWEVHGDGSPTILLLPTWTIVHTRFWKLQIPYLARHHRVVVFDGPGNGRSGRPTDPAAYRVEAVAAAAIEVMDATATDAAVLVALSDGARWSLRVAAHHPERVLGQVLIAPAIALTPAEGGRSPVPARFHERIDDPQGWERYNAHYWREHFDAFAEFFFSEVLSEPHSTKPREDAVAWAMETSPEVLIANVASESSAPDPAELRAWCERIDSPVLVVHGSDDRLIPLAYARELAETIRGELVVLEGSGHMPLARDPVKVNRLIAGFVAGVVP